MNFETHDGVIVAELDRPPQNLFSIELCHTLADLLDDPPADAHVLRFRATGDVFCLGRDRGGATPAEVKGEAQALARLTRSARRTPLVTVAEVQGDAAGFGVGLIAAFDVAVALRTATFRFPEVGIGLAPALVLAWLPRIVGRREAFWLTATGEPLDAERAWDLGLLNEVVDTRDGLTKRVDEMVAALRARSPRVHADIKDMLRAFGELGDDSALDASVDRLVVGSLRRGER
ncbi:enoyl-CoA hydratase/isomerase family protein [Paractinoplanes lichenicola]|uniref:Enoyl-CoA hydratase/isomerase family protein n=1 Tax=Paractinoplanes lichenicola TaxID=2802976 RepID=A0ABS1VVR1_9ACTN|nr:enoyl-CoA hydratase/isomerase family protein [Actinoplanes lichenicola]MBL7258554.1 enoyl-CoA hydratase/isomerase family protein [Actinoplanes lichenicola]